MAYSDATSKMESFVAGWRDRTGYQSECPAVHTACIVRSALRFR